MSMRILLSPGIAKGHVFPLLAVGKALQERGHSVVCAALPPLAGLIEQTGIENVPITADLGLAGLQNAPLLQKLAPMFENTTRFVADYLARNETDLVLSDTVVLSGIWAAELAGVPHVSMSTTPFEFHSASREPEDIRDFDCNVVRRRLGLADKPGDRFDQGISDLCHLLPFPEAFDFGPPPKSGMRIGLLALDLAASVDEWVAERLRSEKPVTVMTMTTGVFRDDEAEKAARCFRLFGQAAETLGDTLVSADAPYWTADAPSPHPPLAFLPHSNELFGRADVFISNGGWGGLSRALLNRVPMVVVPLKEDQPFLAERVSELGIGRALRVEASASELAAAVKELRDPGCDERVKLAALWEECRQATDFSERLISVVNAAQ